MRNDSDSARLRDLFTLSARGSGPFMSFWVMIVSGLHPCTRVHWFSCLCFIERSRRYAYRERLHQSLPREGWFCCLLHRRNDGFIMRLTITHELIPSRRISRGYKLTLRSHYPLHLRKNPIPFGWWQEHGGIRSLQWLVKNFSHSWT